MGEKKYVLITGASSGIGKNTALLLAQNNFDVFAGVRNQEAFDELSSLHTSIKPVFLDVLDSNSIENVANNFKQKNIELFALINNAGAVVAQPIECININDLKYQFEINTIAPVAVAQAFLPLINQTGGKIVNISSMASTGIFPYIAPYCASKRALDILFNSLSLEFKNKNIKIVSIKPGSIKTPIWNKSIEKNRKSIEKLSQFFKEKYEKEMTFLAENAEKNNYKALEVSVVSRKILKVLNTKNPKSSYTVGTDSFLACAVSKLPQDFLNLFIKQKLEKILTH